MDSDAHVGRLSFVNVLPVLAVAATAFVLALGFFLSFDEPFALRGDNKFVHFPMKLEAWRQWTSGAVPFWTNGLWAGFPLLGDATTGAFYLPHALAFLVTPDPHLRAFDVAEAMHVGWLAAGVVVLLRRLGCGLPAAIFGAALSLLASHVLGWTAYVPGFSALAWWPWVLVGADALARDRVNTARAILLASVPLGAQVLAGYPETALYSGCTAAAWILTGAEGPPLRQRLFRTFALAAAAALLAAPQLVPGAYAMLDSTRATAAEARGLLSLQGGLFDVIDPTVGTRQFAVLSPFLGAGTLLLAAVAVGTRSPRSFLLASVALLAAAASLGDRTPVYALVSKIPFFEFFRGPHKFFLITQLLVVWLAALGLHRALTQGSRRLAAAAAVLALAGLIEHAISLGSHLPRVTSGHTRVELEMSDAAAILDRASGVLATPVSPGGPPPRVFTGSYPQSMGSLPMLVGAESLRGGGVALLSPRHQWLRFANLGPRHLDLLGVGVLLLPGVCEKSRFDHPVVLDGEGFCVRRNDGARPRYELLSEVRRSSPEAMEEELRGRRPPRVIAVSAPARVALPSDGGPPGEAVVESYQPGRVVLEVVATGGDRMLLVRESWAPGWQARVDGEPAPTYPAAAIFFAVPIPEGAHRVTLEYRAPGFRIGLAFGALWLGLAVWAARRSR